MREWIKFSERKPNELDLPVWLYAPDRMPGQECCIVHSLECDAYLTIPNTHWRQASGDIPAPPAEPTQQRKDEIAFMQFYENADSGTMELAWHSALACERKIIGQILDEHGHPGLSREQVFEKLRERCSG